MITFQLIISVFGLSKTLAIGENGSKIAHFLHSGRTAHGAPPYMHKLLAQGPSVQLLLGVDTIQSYHHGFCDMLWINLRSLVLTPAPPPPFSACPPSLWLVPLFNANANANANAIGISSVRVSVPRGWAPPFAHGHPNWRGDSNMGSRRPGVAVREKKNSKCPIRPTSPKALH